MARYADSLMSQGEVVVMRTRQHWLAMVARARVGIALFVIGVVIWLLSFKLKSDGLEGTVGQVGGWLGVLLVLVGLVIFLARFWTWWAEDYMVTNRRLLKVTGVLAKRSADSALEKINDAVLSQSVFGRMFNFGDLEILTAADQSVDRYHMLNNPKEFKKTMLDQKHNLETEFMVGRPPTPPLRAEQPAAPQMPATPPPAPAPAAPAAPAMTSEEQSRETTETLARLADLRDKGAISAEEYEQKKGELLGRL